MGLNDSRNLPLFGQDSLVPPEQMPVSRQDVINFFNNTLEKLINPQFEMINRKLNSVDTFIAFLDTVGMPVVDGRVKLSHEEISKWAMELKARAENMKAEIKAADAPAN